MLLDRQFCATVEDFCVGLEGWLDLVVEEGRYLLWGAADKGAGLEQAVELRMDGRVEVIAADAIHQIVVAPLLFYHSGGGTSAHGWIRALLGGRHRP